MSWIELLLLAVGLCFDTFAVSLSGGICIGRKLRTWEVLKIIFCFAIFQSGFAFAGWALGLTVSEYISRLDHWVALLLLGYIGGKMLYDGITSKEEECPQEDTSETASHGSVNSSGSQNQLSAKEKQSLLDTRQRVLLSIATSIDAVAVGISIAFLQLPFVKIGVGVVEIFVCTALASLVGLLGGRRLGTRIGNKSSIIGGLILIAIGLKIFIEHTC